MKTLSDKDSSLVSKCMEFTKHLANQGRDFKFSLSLPSGFSFSLDISNEKTSTRIPEKKKSPSTLRRNSQRRKAYLEKKAMEKQAEEHIVHSQPTSRNKYILCDQCGETFQDSDLLNNHIIEIHEALLTCEECHHISKSKKELIDHERKHVIPQLDGHNDNSERKQEHDELWCFKCEEMAPDCQGWEFQFSNRPAIKAHMHNEHKITIMEDIDINQHGGFSYYLV